MTDKPKASTKKESFPIRNFARLLDEFIAHHDIETSDTVGVLVAYANAALVEQYADTFKKLAGGIVMTPPRNYDNYSQEDWDTTSEHRSFAIAAGLQLLHRLTKEIKER